MSLDEPQPMPREDHGPLGVARSGVRAAVLGAWTVGLMPLAVPHLRTRPDATRELWRRRWVGLWARGLTQAFGVQQHRVGVLPAHQGRARLIVANHRSPLDIILMLEHFGGTVLSRADLQHWPVLGVAAEIGGTIFVDRDDERSGVKAIREIRRRLQAQQSVIVFPEGTTHRGDEVRPFVGGAFAAARGLEVDVLPVGIAYDPGVEFVDESFGQHLARVAQRPRTRVAFCAGEPIIASRDRESMAKEARQRVQALVHRARAALPER